MYTLRKLTSLTAASMTLAGCAPKSKPASPSPARTAQAAPPTSAATAQPATGTRRPRPYRQVITERAASDDGAITTHRVDDRWFFEVPDSLISRDMLLVSRISGVPANIGGFTSAGQSLEERLVRWERSAERVMLRSLSVDAYADDSLPIALSVASNNVGVILASFPVQAYGSDSASFVLDVTDFFAGETPGISGLSAAQRRQYQVRRLDPHRSFVDAIKSFPGNVEVRHTQTFEASEPPGDRSGGAITLEMRQSLVVLPKVPMRPRYADPRAGFFTVSRINYGLDEQKAAEQRFIRRWRLEPKDPAAYARGELVEPVKPIIYYLDPATPAKWRPYVRKGIEDWQKVFERAGFREAIVARDAPSAQEDPDWDPEDSRYSVVRWAASTVRNAVGPSTSDPRTGEIIESDITWYHNHMRSYRNRLVIETGAANPAARSLEIPEELMGETMRQVITHEVGHALGLPHNMIASSSFPVDSLRSKSFVNRFGVSATIMDYARQNYVAQPGDGLAPLDFVRRLGPFDDFIINWGYRVFPQARTAEEEKPILNRMLVDQSGPMPYRYLPQFLAGIDPRSQTEDIGNDPIAASSYGVANLKRVVPNLVQWASRPGDDYSDLAEIYGETVGIWSLYMGHVAALIGGLEVDLRSADQAGAVYRPVPAGRQKAAIAFLEREVFRDPQWLTPASILSRIGPQTGGAALRTRQANLLAALLDARRLARIDAGAAYGGTGHYTLAEYFSDLHAAVWQGVGPDEARRGLHRVYLERLEMLLRPAAPSATGAQGGGATPAPALLVAPNVARSDISALAGSELRSIRLAARRHAARAESRLLRAHWEDIAKRVEVILEPSRAAQ
jgi:hypothetical protein